MDNDSFARLEQRVADAVRMITELRQEREEWTRERAELDGNLQELQRRNRELQGELDEIRRGSVPREEFEARKGQIERRVQSLLSRFEELDQAETATG